MDMEAPKTDHSNNSYHSEPDAGKEFVLQSKGTWLHAAYHLTSATAGAPLLALPFAIASLGWASGIIALVLSAMVNFYACYLLSAAMEELESRGVRCLRFWDMALHLIGPSWAYYVVAPLQYLICIVVVIALVLLGGDTLQGIVDTTTSHSQLKLYEYTIIFGGAALLLSQIPSFHDLRHFNLLSMILCYGYSICAVAGAVVAGSSKSAPVKDYSIRGSHIDVLFGIFNAISIMITAFANPIIVEIQATLAPPVSGKILKGLLVCYFVSISTFFSVGISGYWAFGNAVEGVVFSNMETLIPKWLYILGNVFLCLQLIICSVVYLQPLFAKYEGIAVDAKAGRYDLRNVLIRIFGRCAFVAISIFFAAMLPFFADFNALLGACGLFPVCIILPLLFHILVFKDKTMTSSKLHWLNGIIIGLASIAATVGTIAAIRQIAVDAHTYRLFPSS